MMATMQRPRPLSAATDLTDVTDVTDVTDQIERAIEVDVRRHLIRFPRLPHDATRELS